MAEVVVGAVVTVLIEKLLAGDFMNFARSQGIDSQLKKWNRTLPMIQAVLADAAQKQITQKLVELWMVELQDLVYDIEDVLDDIATEAMKRNLQESDGSIRSSKVLKMIPLTCCTNSYTPHNIMYGRKMSSKLDELSTRLQDLFELSVSLGLKIVNDETSASYRTNKRLEETSLLPDLSDPLGREADRDALLGKLLGDEGASSNQNVSVVSIVGMGGIGKTTLARLLYNDPKVEAHFKTKAWVCVSDDFDVFSISKQIYQALFGVDKTFTNLELLQKDLAQELSEKRFLLVLDDVWNEDPEKWQLLKKPLVGAPGSKVIVTTRNTTVASVMNSVHLHNLGVLEEEIALSLFAQYALGEQNFGKYQPLSKTARGIVEKCGGLPLALVTLGRVLKTKGTDDVAEWEALLNSEVWSSLDGSGILPALKLSYYHLPSHLKQLFVYCSLYPKDHLFDKNKLVLKWMAQGFLSQPRGGKSMEILGHECFEELLSRCFFQPSTNARYTMHDLMNDLAKSVAGKFFCMVDKNGQIKDFEKLRHFSFTGEADAKYINVKELHKARCLRTFLPVGYRAGYNRLDNALVKLLTRLQFLRVLSLTDHSITEVPKSIGNLTHLKYLNFSETRIREIPKQVGKLYNLQSLLVRNCGELSCLPRSLVKLKNLLHLDMARTPLMKNMPLVIACLTSLHALPGGVCIERGNEFKISHLKGLSNLQGELSIKGLHNVTNPNDANLHEKKGLDDLHMEWSDVFNASRDPKTEYDVLEKLRPPSKLKKLSIFFYGGMESPSWLGDPTSFDHLSKLTLEGCENCKDLTLGRLSSLRELCLSSMEALQTVGLEVGYIESLKIWSTSAGDDDQTPRSFPRLRVSIQRCPKLGKVSFGSMPSLESLEIHDLESLEIWSIGAGEDDKTPQSLPRLRVISIKRCPKLGNVSFGSIPSLESLKIHDLESLEIWSIGAGEDDETTQSFPRLRVISIKRCPKLGNVSFGSMPSLESLEVEDMKSLERWPIGVGEDDETPQSFPRLRVISIERCPKLGNVSFGSIPSLESLEVHEMESLERWPIGVGEDDETLQSLPSLRVISIHSCPKLGNVSFGSMPSLESLKVKDMKSLEIWSIGTGENDETPPPLPRLWEISFRRCWKLGKVSFGLMPLLKDLTVEGCPEAVFRGLVGVSSSISTLRLKEIKGLTQLDSEVLKHLGAVEDLSFYGCQELRYMWEACSRFLGSLQKLEIGYCLKLVSINKGEKEVVNVGSSIMRSLREVELWHCDALESYCCPTSVERLEIRFCDSMTSLSFSILQEDLPSSSSSLKFIKVECCKNIKSIAHEHLQSFTSLEEMRISNCPNMEDSFPSRGMLWPPNLRNLGIGKLKKPMSEWGIQNYPPSLVQLVLIGDNSVLSFGIIREEQEDHNNTISSSCFLLPPSLTSLEIWAFRKVESLSEVLQHHPHLQKVSRDLMTHQRQLHGGKWIWV